MNKRPLTSLLMFFAVLICGAVLFDKILVMHWVGRADLEVTFLLTDAKTGEPVSEGSVQIDVLNDRPGNAKPAALTLHTSPDGVAQTICRGVMCSGARSGLRITDAIFMPTPSWKYRASAPRYTTTDKIDLRTAENVPEAVRPHVARLRVNVAMQREE